MRSHVQSSYTSRDMIEHVCLSYMNMYNQAKENKKARCFKGF